MINQRPIKFRAWAIELNHFIPAHQGLTECLLFKDGFKMPVLTLGQNEDYENVILMQFTGLHDKNGVEIYEGDVVRLKWEEVNPSNGDCWKEDSIHEVKYVGESFNIFSKVCCPAREPEVEVIGNIYENPELLNNNN